MNVDRNIKLPDLILSTPLLSKLILKTDIGLKLCFRKKCKMTLKMWVALELSLHLGNQKPQCHDFDILCKANNGT